MYMCGNLFALFSQIVLRRNMNNKTAGIIIVGDEILKGQIVDTNSSFIVKRLYNLGIKVRKISVVPDDVITVADEVLLFSKQFDIVITTGGIGPTHDDITYAGVAKAFNEELILNKELKELVFSLTTEKSTDISKNPAIRMAQIPKSATLHYPKRNTRGSFLDVMPIVSVANVYIFPGIPSYLQHLFVNLEYIFVNDDNCTFFEQCLYLNIYEMDLLVPLNSAVKKFEDSVTFGSYPVVDNSTFFTKITIESLYKDKVWEAEKFFLSHLPKKCVIKKDTFHPSDVIASIYNGAMKLSKCKLVENLTNSIKVLEECLKKYSLSDISISFNGGKDCTVLLHITCAVLWRLYPQMRNQKIQCIYIAYEDSFPDVEAFITESIKRYNLDVRIVPGPIKKALGTILSEKPNLKAVLMGTRRTDPYSVSLKPFQMTDKDWPQVMRVSPVLDWSYEDIWTFLRELNVPYCNLYDMGYTSIGSHKNTAPNPRLQYTDANGQIKYKPAYHLEDEKSERSGRN